MRVTTLLPISAGLLFTCLAFTQTQQNATPAAAAAAAAAAQNEPIQKMVARLNLMRYKTTIRGLTKFGDRRQGTDRNKAAIDWIEEQLKSYGCTNTERIHYTYTPPPPRGGRGRGATDTAAADAAANGDTPPAAAAAGGRGGRGGGGGNGGGGNGGAAGGAGGDAAGGGRLPGGGRAGGRIRGDRIPESVNNDADLQHDTRLRELNSQPSTAGPREEVFCTKIGSTHPEEMYIVSGHMDGIGWGEAANDDGSGSAIVMELARIFSSPDVTTERSIRFALWNNEETGLNGAHAYVDQRKDLQGKEDPPGSGKYPEPKWLGMIQHDMMMFDHGMPLKDGTISDHQRPEADVNIEFQSKSKFASGAADLAWAFLAANETFATDYPASVGPHMSNTDSDPFMDLVPAISLRELERIAQIGGGWDPSHHQPTDVFSHFSDGDFKLGLNAAQTTLGAVARLAGAKLK
jgi:hypothetical protein